uniref:Dynein regulatory complex protein 9 n=2 Tax=Petromyzon marinus TaxID=7757 RepID=A0AAJ7U791_PETMA|nr:dynein regulatory complex protein 9 isoform X1 [Petromyzon marinus]
MHTQRPTMDGEAASRGPGGRVAAPPGGQTHLSPVDALCVSLILEDCLHQLEILGCIAPCAPAKIPGIRTSTDQEFRDAPGQDPIPSDTLRKVQADRRFAEAVIAETLQEVRAGGTFQSLLSAVASEKEKRDAHDAAIAREEEARKRVAALQKEIYDLKKEKENELQRLEEEITTLKDELQEAKARSAMEGRYARRMAQARLSQAARRREHVELALRDEVQTLGSELDNENRVHMDIDTFLRRHYADLSEQLEFWMEKYDHDLEAKQQELNNLKATHASDLAHLQDLARQYSEFEAVVIEDRLEREAERKRLEQEELELRCTVKIQAWWRGVMVRRGLGQYKAPKKAKKGKKGKKAKKGGKKKK